MKIWLLEVDFGEHESFQVTNTENDFYEEFCNRITSGKPQNQYFDNMDIRLIEGTVPSDLPKLWSSVGTMLFSEKAKECLEDLMENCVEFIPVRCEKRVFYIVNIINILDAIDYKQSTFRKLGTGLIVGIKNYAFIKEKLKQYNIFKVMLNNHIYSTEVFVTTNFKSKVEECGLSGFKFTEVWKTDK